MEILGTYVVLKSGNPLGQVAEDCYLTVRALLYRVTIEFNPER